MVCSKDTEIEDTKPYLLRPDYVEHRFDQALVGGEIYGYPGTNGSWFSNFVDFAKGEHSFLGIFFAHPRHPFSKTERFFFMFSAMSMLFMLQAIFYTAREDDPDPSTGYVEGFIVCMICVPYKKIMRFIMECPCFYSGKYDHTDFESKQDEKFDINDAQEIAAGCCEKLGSMITCANFFFAVMLLIIGIVTVSADNDGSTFAGEWAYAQAMSLFGTEIATIAVFSFLAVKVEMFGFSQKVKFEAKWRHLFPQRKPPVSYTDVACLAKWNYIIIDPNGGQAKFDKYFPDYDKNFEITSDIDGYYKAWKEAEKNGEETPVSADPCEDIELVDKAEAGKATEPETMEDKIAAAEAKAAAAKEGNTI